MKISFPGQRARRVLATLVAVSLPGAGQIDSAPPPIPSADSCGWTLAPPFPDMVHRAAIASLGGFLYSFGGRNDRPACYKFDGTSWTAIAPMPVNLDAASAVSDGTYIYILGGADPDGHPVNHFYRYNPTTNTYTRLLGFKEATSAHASVYLNGKIYKFGGQPAGNFQPTTDSLEIYDINANRWTQGATCFLSASYVAGFAQGNYVYAAGGFQDYVTITSKTYRYDPAADAWDDVAIADLPAKRSWAAAATFDGVGVLAGGQVGGLSYSDITSSVIYWDAGSNTWRNLPNMLLARRDLAGAVLNGSLYLVGGNTGTGTLNRNEKLTCPVIPTPTPAPTPTPFPTPAQLLNISTRMRVGTGDNVLIGGFILTGTGSKLMIVRGIGPSLFPLGISEALADPTLEIRFADGYLASSNNDWQQDPAQAAQLIARGLALQDASESGLVSAVGFGGAPHLSLTAILAGFRGGTGVGLLEIYDISPENSQLANISTRGLVENGENLMIGGFILGRGSNNTRIVVRGIGPSLSGVGLSPVLNDPTIELHDVNGAVLASNDNWQDDAAAASQLIAFGLAPPNTLESAIFAVLPPGSFTAVLAGKNGGTGIGLVEIYNLH